MSVNQLSQSNEIVKLGGQVYTDQETDKALESIPASVKEDFQNHLFTSQFWKQIEKTHTPLDLLKERKGSWDKHTKTHKWLEYFPEEYTIQELNRLFPGWWNEDMKVAYEPTLRTVHVSGYLFVEVPTLQGKQVIKRWAIGASRVEYKWEDGKKTADAAQPDDKFKAARTEWIKLAGKWFGIGLEIYHQRITPEMRSHFEDIVRPLGLYAGSYLKIAQTFTTGQGFRNYLRQLPNLDQVKRITTAVDKIPADLQNDKGKNVKELIMQNFVLNKNDSDENREKFEEFIKQIEHVAAQYSTTDNQTKEA
jgi:hypothetical protein